MSSESLVLLLQVLLSRNKRHPSAFLSGACAFLRKKYSYLDVAPEPLAFQNEELEGLFKLNFGRLRHVFSHFAFCFGC